MVSRFFQGSIAAWYDPASWSPSGVPQDGDLATIAAGTATISAADALANGPFGDIQVAIGSTVSATPAGLSVADEGFGTGFVLDATGAAQLTLTGSVSYAGTLLATAPGAALAIDVVPDAGTTGILSLTGSVLVDNGDQVTINGGTIVDGGVMTVRSGTLTLGSGSVLQGAGTIVVGAAGVVRLDGTVASGVTIAFEGVGGTLQIGDPLAFQGSVVNFLKGDGIDLLNAPSDKWSYNTGTATLTVSGGDASSSNPLVARFGLTSSVPLTRQQIFVGDDGAGGSQVQIVDIRTWAVAAGDWFDADNWTTAGTLSPNSYPLPGDTAIISAGTATITTAGFAQHGVLDDGVILLNGTSADLVLGSGTIGPDLTIAVSASHDVGTLAVRGSVTSDGTLRSTGVGSTLLLDLAGDGTTQGQFVNGVSAQVVIGWESALSVEGGELTNLGRIVQNGAMTIAAGATLDGSGLVEMDTQGSTLTVAGTVGPQQQVSMYQNVIVVAPTGRFLGTIESFGNGDTIDLQGVSATSATFDDDADVLTLWNAGTAVAQLAIAGDYASADFGLSADGSGGVLVTDVNPVTQDLFYTTLPTPAVLSAGESTTLRHLLIQSFGTDYARTITQVQVSSPSQGDLSYFSYWDPNEPALPYWTLNGTRVPADAALTVQAADFDKVDYVAGNLIWAGADIQVTTATEGGQAAYTLAYQINTFPTACAQPSLRSGAPTAQDVVNAATAFAALYSNAPNTEDCFNIAHEVAAAAGASMVYQTWSTDPTQNVAGGFWRIHYAAPQDGSAVANWSTLVEAGDILRIGWADNGGPHSFTILQGLDSSGSITVFDNVATGIPSGYEAIGIHGMQYWTETDPADITIFRLDPNALYLVDDVTSDGQIVQSLTNAIMQGTTFSDLIIPAGANGTIVTGLGADVVAGASGILNGATILDFGIGDTIALTDLDLAGSSISYDPTVGRLAVNQGNVLVDSILLPTNLAGSLAIESIGGTAGLDGGLLGTLYPTLFTNPEADGLAITLVTCFAAGTTIRTPNGPVPVEHLREGEEVTCIDGVARPIGWIGRRSIDVTRHPAPGSVLPIRIAADAFGPAQPERPLLLSPDHAVHVDGVLIPVKHLVNGGSIAQLSTRDMPAVHYLHLELARHHVVFAEGMPVETYLDTGDRGRFANAPGPVALFPDFASRVWEAEGYAPLVVTGPRLDAVRRRLAKTGSSRKTAPRRAAA